MYLNINNIIMDTRSPNWKETKFPLESKLEKKILCYIHILESAHHWKFCISENLREMYHLFPLSALAPIQLPTIMSLPIIDYVPITFYSVLPCARPELFVTEWYHLHNNLEWNLCLPQPLLLSTIVLF